MTKALFFQ